VVCGLSSTPKGETNVATESKRGSAALIEQQPITRAQLEQVVDILKEHDVEIVHWFPKGIPNPEVLYGAVKTRPEVVGKLVGKIVATEGVRLRLDVFPLGIPFPDEVLIQFETPQGYIGG
jgi:hypothetical protein